MTLVVAHRTCARDVRENSLDGIALAARLGADVVEVDARRSGDGTPVLLHDPWLGRVQHVPLPVRWASPSLLARLRVPTLIAALEAARTAGIRVAIDTKDAGAADAVVEELQVVVGQAVGGESCGQGVDLTGNGPLLGLVVGGDAGIEGRANPTAFSHDDSFLLLTDSVASPIELAGGLIEGLRWGDDGTIFS